MRIAFLCKRRYMAKDVILDRYARLYEIPRQLARRGHQVLGLCFSYQNSVDGVWRHEAGAGQLEWESRSPGALWVPALLSYPAQALKRLRAFRPDVVIGASDIPHVCLGAWLAKRLGVPYVADLYDNFEGFGQASIPGMKAALRRGVRSAQLVATTSSPLADHVRDVYRASGEILSMPSTIDESLFFPRNRRECRAALGLPEQALLVGTAGGLHADKGIGVLYEAWNSLSARRPDVQLVLAGPSDKQLPPPASARCHYLGQLSHEQTAMLFSALDVGVIYLRETAFGRYCFPQKAYEMLACGLSPVAADVGAMRALFGSTPQCLYRADDSDSLVDTIERQLAQPTRPGVIIRNWEETIGELDDRIRAVVQPTSR